MLRQRILILVAVSGLLAVACGPKPRATPTPIPTPVDIRTPALTPTSTPIAAAEEGRVNLDKIFPPAPGRDLIILDCQQCHNLAPLVIAGSSMDEGAWDLNRRNHEVGRVLALTTEQRDLLWGYLKSHFGPDKPVPELPESWFAGWTSY